MYYHMHFTVQLHKTTYCLPHSVAYYYGAPFAPITQLRARVSKLHFMPVHPYTGYIGTLFGFLVM